MTGSISRRLLPPGPTAPVAVAAAAAAEAPLPLVLRPAAAAALRCNDRTLELEPPADQTQKQGLYGSCVAVLKLKEE